jgi:hypothetical protein
VAADIEADAVAVMQVLTHAPMHPTNHQRMLDILLNEFFDMLGTLCAAAA